MNFFEFLLYWSGTIQLLQYFWVLINPLTSDFAWNLPEHSFALEFLQIHQSNWQHFSLFATFPLLHVSLMAFHQFQSSSRLTALYIPTWVTYIRKFKLLNWSIEVWVNVEGNFVGRIIFFIFVLMMFKFSNTFFFGRRSVDQFSKLSFYWGLDDVWWKSFSWFIFLTFPALILNLIFTFLTFSFHIHCFLPQILLIFLIYKWFSWYFFRQTPQKFLNFIEN